MDRIKKRQEIRLLAVDMDGTCVDGFHQVPERNLWALDVACRSGILVVPATGRAVTGYPVAIRKLPGIRYVISSNGARITDLKTGEDIHKVLIPCAEAADFLKELRKEAVWVAIHRNGSCIDANRIPFIHRRLFYHGDFKESRRISHLDRFLEECASSEEAETQENGVEKLQIFFLTKKARRRTLELLKKWPQFSCALSHSRYVEITAFGASKGEALKVLCDRLEIPASQVMAVGDSDNDLSMFAFAGYPVAMGNASEKVKQAAVWVTGRNSECGVAQAVIHALLDL